MPHNTLSGEGVDEVEVYSELAVVNRADPPHDHIIGSRIFPVRCDDVIGSRWSSVRQALPSERAKTAATREVVLDDTRNIQPAVGGHRAGELTHRDGHRLGNPGGTLDLQLRVNGHRRHHRNGGGEQEASQSAKNGHRHLTICNSNYRPLSE